MARPYRIIGNPRPVVDRHPHTREVTEGYEVHATDTETGATAKVFVPKAEFTPATVNSHVQHELDKLHAVRQLPDSLPAA